MWVVGLAIITGCSGVPAEFDTRQDLEHWADNSRLGGWCQYLTIREKKVAIVYRNLFSGRTNTDVSVFVQDGRRWRLAATRGPVVDAHVEMHRESDRLVFKNRFDNTTLFVVPFTALDDTTR